jgi:peptidoglycan/xylan/chitin deacetylase (PgdA/CDA1 family)
MATVVNVLFHGIGTPRRELEPGEAKYWVTVDRFHEVLDEVGTWPRARISFDDGNASDVEYGLPELLRRNLTATFFMLAGRIDQPGSITADGIRELHGAGMRIGTHGMWHRSWRNLTSRDSRDELVTARDRIAEVIGAPVDHAGLPLGQYDRRVLAELRRLGYARVFTSDRRTAESDDWLQARFSVCEYDTAASIRAAVYEQSPLRRARGVTVGMVKRWR